MEKKSCQIHIDMATTEVCSRFDADFNNSSGGIGGNCRLVDGMIDQDSKQEGKLGKREVTKEVSAGLSILHKCVCVYC